MPAPPSPPKPKPSLHSLHTVRRLSSRTPLISHPSTPSSPNHGYDTMPVLASPSPRRPLLNAALKLAVVFVLSSVVLGGTLYLAIPPLDAEDRPLLHIPRSFSDLKALNTLLVKYKSLYPVRTLLCFVVSYLFDQAFSLPGSMYLSILAGAVWGFWFALPLCCTCTATGACLCYLLSAALGPALLALPTWSARVSRFRSTLDSHRANLFSFLIVLRIAPFPPHWVTNVLCPHLGVPLPFFWLTAWLGILAPTVIHVMIGGGLEQMTSAEDFHLLSVRNVLGLGAIVVAALVPVGIRAKWKGEIEEVGEAEAEAERDAEAGGEEEGYKDGVLVSSETTVVRDADAEPEPRKENNGLLVLLKDDEGEREREDEEQEAEEEGRKAGGVGMPEERAGNRWWGWWRRRGVRLA